ncbi:MAG: hypothetical protein A2076_12880 [Geobacteraceae bacterium GWC2_53_11]|nr:MAG: hypothetical protein A2076_12880 [Geobacteraceae bacterium GWC2_53_11]
MIEQFVSGIATRMGMNLSKVTLVDGQPLGCIDVQLLNMSSKGHVVSALVFQVDIENLKNGVGCDSLEVRMRSSLSRLQKLLEPR